jgi:cytochrome c oxidase subunit IV
MAQDRSTHGPAHPAVGHVVPLPTLFAVLGSLLVLTFATVAATWFDFGRAAVWVALGIAVVKASLVLLFFMHLKWDKPFNGVILIISLALVALFISITLTDSAHYKPDTIPGYAPDIKTNPS